MPHIVDWLEYQNLVFSCSLNDHLTSFRDILWNVQFLWSLCIKGGQWNPMKYKPSIDFGGEGHDCGSQLNELYEADEMSLHGERPPVIWERLLNVGLRQIVDHEDIAGLVRDGNEGSSLSLMYGFMPLILRLSLSFVLRRPSNESHLVENWP